MLKTTLVLALFLVFALSTKPLLGATNHEPEQVIDTSGKIVRAGSHYYNIISATPNLSGISLAIFTGNETCPLDVATIDGFHGLPVVFQPVNAKKGVVRVNTDLNIMFSYDSRCESMVWKLKDYDYATRQRFVTTNGVLGNPGANTISNWFRIEKYEDDYKLSYCPKVCPSCRHPCMDIGVHKDHNNWGKHRLALSNVPFKLRFQRA
ncbi:hypothetical protein HN51_008287 [Arachis hypogaea]|uniref:Miraculin n=1 Tax=Arachis hypogaea TaxID=3818 RepID=A0A445D4J8_ARAHY|nr:miraculin [Arachis hypogaea]XP_057760771.1 miraculin-like [Arachis stenosperma]QHO42600.1 Miraculin [Arachis hypogaea]RYR57964.1 hypothetical protein Ahy_A05g023635 [Arachis hypogaea]